MKKFLKISFSVLLIALMAAVNLVPVCAAGDTLKFNDTSAKVGDEVTYTLSLGECTEGVVGFQMNLFYDSEYLEVVKGSFSCPNIPGNYLFNEDPTEPEDDSSEGAEEAVENTTKRIPFVFSDINTVDFSKKKVFLTVKFKVVAAGESDITYFFTELYGEDMDHLTSFEFTNDIAVNGKDVVKNAVPKLEQSPDILNSSNGQGAFINYSDGKGDENNTEAYHQAVTGEIPATEVTKTDETDKSSKPENSKKSEKSSGFPFYIVWICVGAAFVAIIAISVIRIVTQKKS